MPNALIAPGGVVDRRRRSLTPQDYELIQAYRGRPVSLDVLGPPPSTMETVGALAPLAGGALLAPSLPLALATIPAYHAITSGALSNLPGIPSMPGEPWATLSDFVLGMGGGGPGAYNRAAVVRRPSPGWKSTLKGLVEAKLPSKATPEQLEAIARYAPKEEVQYVNLSDLAGGPLRKEDVLGHIEQRNVPLEETLRTEGDVRYGSYRTPGGEDYRELLLTLPPKSRGLTFEEWAALNGETIDRTNPFKLEDQQRRYEFAKQTIEPPGEQFKSGHWQEPNVLAHTRLNTFLDPQGKKVLLVDEIQSDWHQAGRERGYSIGAEPDLATLKQKRDELRAQIEAMRPDADQGRIPEADILRVIQDFNQADHAYRQAQRGPDPDRVPDAPFKREWHELAFKRALREAAETGAEKLAWTTGTQQAQRYDLSKRVSEVSYNPETQELYAYDPNGNQVLSETGVSPQSIDRYIGPELGARLRDKAKEYGTVSAKDFKIEPDPAGRGYHITDPQDNWVYNRDGSLKVFPTLESARGEVNHMIEQYIGTPPAASLRGLDLQVGGEGMKGFYDQILPQFANKYLKQFGIKTGETKLPSGEAFHSITITPELREFLMRGQPLFGSKK